MTVITPKTIGELRAQQDSRLEGVIRGLEGVDANSLGVCVIGSTRFYSANSQPICCRIGRIIAASNTVLFTGSMKAVQETVARAAVEVGIEPRRMHHLYPGGTDGKNEGVWKEEDSRFGVWHEVGDCFEKRREALARTASLAILVEGGPGACHEANEILAAGGIVLPIAATGGAASGMVYDKETVASRRVVNLGKASEAVQAVLSRAEIDTLMNKESSLESIEQVIKTAIARHAVTK